MPPLDGEWEGFVQTSSTLGIGSLVPETRVKAPLDLRLGSRLMLKPTRKPCSPQSKQSRLQAA